jgi:AcrR family transcriptional regulator
LSIHPLRGFVEMAAAPKPLRADAARNRARVLQVAYETFAAEGLTVPIDEIARRAGVGAGTIYRHFPTKDALFQAIVADRVRRIVHTARALLAGADPGQALVTFLRMMVQEGAVDQGLSDALAGIGFDIGQAAPEAEQSFMAALDDLLTHAQQAGTVRRDIDVQDVKTLLIGCQAMQRYSSSEDQTRRVVQVMADGLTPAEPAG